MELGSSIQWPTSRTLARKLEDHAQRAELPRSAMDRRERRGGWPGQRGESREQRARAGGVETTPTATRTSTCDGTIYEA
jgi:hypothetical protein